MKKARVIYFLIICSIILLGLLSRQFSFVPTFIGDILWAMMLFFIIRFILIEANIGVIFLVSLMLCYLVEVSQLYQEDWINDIRKTIMGRLILGQGFLLSDIVSYTFGVNIAALIEKLKLRKILNSIDQMVVTNYYADEKHRKCNDK